MKYVNKTSPQKGQSAVEYLLMFAAVTIVVFTALAPEGFFQSAVNQSINMSLLEGTKKMAGCVCYDRETGEPCPAVCGNGCCEEGEGATCPADCDADVYSWSTFGWGSCVPACGPGTRSRVVHCTNSDGDMVGERFCDASTKPADSQACNNGPCNYFWRQSGWGACSVMCGDGTQDMTYECVRGYDGMVTYASYCQDTIGDPPEISQACNIGQCCDCSFQTACTNGDDPCCGFLTCGQFEHAEIQLCTPNGCVNPATLQTRCTPHAGCCVETKEGCGLSPCESSESRFIKTCGDGSVTNVCHEDPSCVFACEGMMPANSELCPGDASELTAPVDYLLVGACTDERKCETFCPSGTTPDAFGAACEFVCTGDPIANASLCDDDDVGLTGPTSYTAVEVCTDSQKCEYVCDPGQEVDPSGLGCGFFCEGDPIENATLCSGDESGLTSEETYQLVASCTDAQKCEYTCDDDYTMDASGNSCILYCQGDPIENASLCADDETDLTVPASYTAVTTCTDAKKCEYECAGERVPDEDAEACIFVCQGDPIENATLCPGDDVGLTEVSYYHPEDICEDEDKCEYVCDHGFAPNEDDTACEISCIGPEIENATLCPGDEKGVTELTKRHAVESCHDEEKCEYLCNPGLAINEDESACVIGCLGADIDTATFCAGSDEGLTESVESSVVADCSASAAKCIFECDTGYAPNADGSDCECVPDCDGKDCGDDGWCGVSCGSCVDPFVCEANACVCYPDCTGKDCGDDGCGGSCGTCTAPETCGGGGTPDVCGCTPNCAGKDCGDDGCGGSCGTCTAPETCGGGGTPDVCG